MFPTLASSGIVRRPITDKVAGVITRIEELSYDLKVEEVMTRSLKTVQPEMRMGAVLDLFRTARISGTPVVAASAPTKLVGVVSMEDMIHALQINDLRAPVSEYMSTKVITARASDPVVEALKTFGARNVGRLPVVDD